LDVAIAGCGPAGLAAALMLQEDGHAVSMFERFETPRPVGSGIILQPTGLAVLRELGLGEEIHALGKRIDLMHGVSMPAAKEVLNVNYSALGEGFHGLAVHRAALFDVLYAAVQSHGIQIHTGVTVAGLSRGGSRVSVLADNEETLGPFDLLIDASGARTQLQRHSQYRTRGRDLEYGALWGSFEWPGSGFDENTLEQRYVGAHTMIGVLPIGRHSEVATDQVAFFWSIKANNYDQWCIDELDAWKNSVRSIWPETEVILEQILDPSQMALAQYGHSTMRQPFGNKIVFIGDAAHSTSPQLGQGANMALLDAWSLVDALRQTDDIDHALRHYAKSRRWHVRAFQFSSLAMTPFYQSDSRVLAGLRDLLFDPVSKLPVARRIVAGLISGMLARPPAGLTYS
jgi:2-polyprenyl-6-methoxyphenol hydroxylase-like FAD-dependent oxidoreductase